jgi:EmrB/QacA subfamily drug resistance transporter
MDAALQPAHPRRWWALGILCLGAFLSPLDFFIVNIALPAIKSDLGLSDSSLQLVVAGYGAAYAVFVVTGGRLGDIYGRKRLFLSGMLLFTISSGACAMSVSSWWLIGARIIQGFAAAMLAPQVLSTIRVIFPREEQPAAMGIFGAVFGLAAISGQLLGGILVKAGLFGLSWQSVFLINIPVGVFTMLTGMYILKENRPLVRQQLDIPGMLLITAALLLFIYPIIKGREAHWPAWVFICLGIALIAGLAFIRVEKSVLSKGKSPLIHLPQFRDRHFVSGLAIIYLYNHTASFFLVYPYYLQRGLHWGVLATGLSVLPYAAGFFTGPLISAAVARRAGNYVISIGQGLLVIGFTGAVVALLLSPEPGWQLTIALFCAGMGHGIVMPSMMRITLAGIDAHVAGQAAGIVSTAIQVGSVLGVALLGTLFFMLLDHYAFNAAISLTLGVLALVQLYAFLLTIKINNIK